MQIHVQVAAKQQQSAGLCRTARAISNITAPPFVAVPVFIAIGIYDQQQRGLTDLQTWAAVTVALFFGVFFPTAFVIYLKSRNLISDFHIPIREQRTVPYAVSIVSYSIGAGLVYWAEGGNALAAAMFCYLLNSTVVMIINLRWKISAHATSISGSLAAMTMIFGWMLASLYLLIPLVAWARVYLRAHTLGQVTMGTILGLSSSAVLLLGIFSTLGWV
jgi:membrane-associated phospholipid phosphatase